MHRKCLEQAWCIVHAVFAKWQIIISIIVCHFYASKFRWENNHSKITKRKSIKDY